MAEAKHTSPDGQTRFHILVQQSHINLAAFRRDYVGITIYREQLETVRFNAFDPSTWAGQRWRRSGRPRVIGSDSRFLDAGGRDISGRIALQNTDRPGHAAAFALFVWTGIGQQPDVLGNDARSVSVVEFDYQLPWEATPRSLTQNSWPW